MDEASAAVASLGQLVNRFRSSLRTEIEHMFTQLTAPRLRGILVETYRDVSYVLDDEGYSDAESRDLFDARFVKSWELLLVHFRGTFPRPISTRTWAWHWMHCSSHGKPW